MSWDINHFLSNNNNVFIVIGFVGAVVVAEDAIPPEQDPVSRWCTVFLDSRGSSLVLESDELLIGDTCIM